MLSDHSFVTKWDISPPIMDKVSACLLGRFIHHGFDLIFAFVIQVHTVGDVFANAAREEDWLLLDDSDLITVPFWVQLLYRDAIKIHLTLAWVVETLDQ